MHKITMPNGTVQYYRGNKLVCVKKPCGEMVDAPPKHLTRSLEDVFGKKLNWLQRPEWTPFDLDKEDKS